MSPCLGMIRERPRGLEPKTKDSVLDSNKEVVRGLSSGAVGARMKGWGTGVGELGWYGSGEKKERRTIRSGSESGASDELARTEEWYTRSGMTGEFCPVAGPIGCTTCAEETFLSLFPVELICDVSIWTSCSSVIKTSVSAIQPEKG